MKKNSSFEDLSKSVERLVKKRESDTMGNYKLSYRKLRNKLQMIYLGYEREDGVNISKRELRKLDKETAKIMIDMYRENKKATENTLKDIFDKAFETVNNTTEKYNIEAVSRHIDPTKVINKEVAGHIWTERIDKYGSDFIYDVHGIIHHGMTNGETFTSMAKKLRDRFGKDIGNTVRIARTEGARVLEDSKYESMKDIAENESVQVFKVWHTMGDEAVRDTHIAMEGVKVPYDEEFVLPSGARCLYPKDTGVPSEDINCRCYVEYVTEVDEKLYKDIANDFIDVSPGTVEDLNEVEVDGIVYSVDRKEAVLDYSKHEKEVAEWIAYNMGGIIKMCPRVVIPKGIRTPDYIWNGEKWDLKTINSHSKNTISTAIRNAKKQSENVVLNLNISSYTDEELINELDRIYANDRYSFLEKIMIIEDYVLRGIYKRK